MKTDMKNTINKCKCVKDIFIFKKGTEYEYQQNNRKYNVIEGSCRIEYLNLKKFNKNFELIDNE